MALGKIKPFFSKQYLMERKIFTKAGLLGCLLLMLLPFAGIAWSDHTLLVSRALRELTVWKNQDSIQAKSLKTFLAETEKELALFLAGQETWSRANLPNYAKCPENLAFVATGNSADILDRFYRAIRMNPGVKIPLYLCLLPGQVPGTRPVAPPQELTTLKDVGSMAFATYVRVSEGEMVLPFEVLCSATDEPDYGFDLGLFEDNLTGYGKIYGFGLQPFGNPNLEYSSQAPFHMGFYHEAGILYKFGAFLKQTHLDYRIFLYKALSEFAFRQNQPYWGWRFMGWGMHYLGDVSMPYHMKPLPGVSTMRMIWINLKSMLGMPKAQRNAVQLVSNRHTVLEEFQFQSIRKALQMNDNNSLLLTALENPAPAAAFSYEFLMNNASASSAGDAKRVDKALKKNVPEVLVSDPAVEANDRPEIKVILQTMQESGGAESVNNLTQALVPRMQQFSRDIRSFAEAVLNETRNKE